MTQANSAPPRRIIRGFITVALGAVCIAAPYFADTLAPSLIGVILIASGVLELANIYSAFDRAGQRYSYVSGAMSLLAGSILWLRPAFLLRPLTVFLAITFGIDAVSRLWSALAGTSRSGWVRGIIGGGINLALAVFMIVDWPMSGPLALGWFMGLRLLANGWAMLMPSAPAAVVAEPVDTADRHPDLRLGLPAGPAFAERNRAVAAELAARQSVDFYWCVMFLVTFFAVHVGRMRAEWNLVGSIGPGIAVLGDYCTALIIAFALVMPVWMLWRRVTRPLERRLWNRGTDEGKGWLGWPARKWLHHRYRTAYRWNEIHRSPRATLRWGMQTGLPLAAVLIALNPIWGFSWYFNSENWASGVWDRWAEYRTDGWRLAMVKAIRATHEQIPADQLFQVKPDGLAGDFSFIVIGDPGEGDDSQNCLKDQILAVAARPETKFVVVLSDVIYPSGAMFDYERCFYMPFKGVSKPIYAIPGNHDWYDANEGFNANFLEPAAARAALKARVEIDNRITTTTDTHIENLIARAAELRREYGIATGLQRAPFAEIQSENFALIMVDTGVMRRVDEEQMAWFKAALARSRGKFVMALLGHPLYAGGRYAAKGDEPFEAIHQLLRDQGAAIVMAGDTHDLEHYRETYEAGGKTRIMQHFVNGGGGAYLSIGTAMDFPAEPPVPDCAIYPRRDQVIAKLDRQTPPWKQPLWWWAKRFRAWPSTTETIASAFDFNGAPFFQSFCEVRVEVSQQRVLIRPYGANGRLRWRELQTWGADRPSGAGDDDFVEYAVPMARR